MSRFILDTDTLSLYFRHDPNVLAGVVRHLSDHVAVPIITVQEVWDGWAAVIGRAKTPEQAATAYQRLTDTLNELRYWPVVSFSLGAVNRYTALKRQKLNVKGNDLKIAAIALETGSAVVTHNRRDFERIRGVQIEDWAT
ncbi:type II toxin-antitoxin system VapC family toxin [Gemmata sp.]|uniref:type II toxin-antitoxin system VapC family toxin n=1 Tax=Gemmata sp. TaxID=1914242 RepID=UPI003F71EB28